MKNDLNITENQKRKRILNSNKHLISYLKENEEFHVGLLYEDFLKSQDLSKYGLPKVFTDEKIIVPAPIGSATKANVYGKFVRKQPEVKEIKKVHIKYNRKSGALVEFDRNYYVYVKELLHKFNISFEFKTNEHGQKVIVSNKLIYNDEPINIYKNTQVINMYCEIFGDFEIFSTKLEPAIHFNKRFELELLPKGKFNDKSLEEILEISKHYSKNDKVHEAFQKRLHILKEYEPDIRGKGPLGFGGYIAFGFTNLNIIILETMYSDNATYVFKMDDYEKNVIQDKQQAIKNKQLIRRFYHYDNWEYQIKKYIEGLNAKIK
jgi:hypothetical protein